MNFATIIAVYDDGVTLRFDDGTESTKHYKTNSSITFTAGQRVKIFQAAGTIVVEYPIGG
jgi:hypothetical protein